MSCLLDVMNVAGIVIGITHLGNSLIVYLMDNYMLRSDSVLGSNYINLQSTFE